jgi:hypothetical protein
MPEISSNERRVLMLALGAEVVLTHRDNGFEVWPFCFTTSTMYTSSQLLSLGFEKIIVKALPVAGQSRPPRN